MAARKKHASWIVWLRRAIQTFFLLFFIYLFLETVFDASNDLGKPVDLFFHIDPLVTLGTFLAAHAVPLVQWFALITLIVTVIFGRWFCGWLCPFGVLHNLFSGMRRRKMKDLMQQGAYTSGQKIKYYILIGCLAGALFGVNAVGWMDPFSFFYRSLATSVYPAVNWGLETFFTWIYMADPHIGPLHATSITEPIYERLRDHFLAVKQPTYVWSVLLGVLFVAIVGLNFYKGRFWCRYLCPLGALLGVAGKNPVFRLTKKIEDCHNCRMCLVDCQGGAEPQTLSEWKPSECFYCWNCRDACSTQAISFQFQLVKPGIEENQPVASPPEIETPKSVESDESALPETTPIPAKSPAKPHAAAKAQAKSTPRTKRRKK